MLEIYQESLGSEKARLVKESKITCLKAYFKELAM